MFEFESPPHHSTSSPHHSTSPPPLITNAEIDTSKQVVRGRRCFQEERERDEESEREGERERGKGGKGEGVSVFDYIESPVRKYPTRSNSSSFYGGG